jgi:chromosome segregation ATPase
MVSRTTGQYQSQPRPRPAARPSLESWEGVNENVRSQPARAQSSVRYPSNGRSTTGSVARQTPRMEAPQKYPSNMTRPRPISAGRIRASSQQVPEAVHGHQSQQATDDPNEIARQILDLRDRRESLSHLKLRKSMEPPSRPAVPQSRSNLSEHSRDHQQHAAPASPQSRGVKPAGAKVSKDEAIAEERLKRAENKISGLLDELEELKFFQELESATPAISTPKTPSHNQITRSASNASRNVSQTASVNRDRAPSRGRDVDRAPSRSRDIVPTAPAPGIPLTIRAISPARGVRLPPPPAVSAGGATPRSAPINTPMAQHLSKNGNVGGLETYRPLSPRAIAKLDRNSLELECQTLVRKLQITEQDRNSQAAMVEMYEISLQDHDADKAKVQKLQGELGKVSGELKRQLQSMTKGKESLVKEYEEKLQHNIAKLHRTQEKADSYKMDLEVTQEEVKRAKQEGDMFRHKINEERARAEEYKNREATLEMQLQEARNLNASLAQNIDQKRDELSSLQNELTQTSQQLRDKELERNRFYEAKMDALRHELSVEKDKGNRLEKDLRDRDDLANEYERRLDIAQVNESEQNALIQKLQGRVEDLEKETVAKFEEGKKATKTAETKKMQELVAERANQSREYERRLKAMQEQLRHQADRHHAEIQETRRRNDERLEAMRDEIREELRIQEGEKMLKLETELSVLRRTYEGAKEDFAARLKEAQQKSRDAAADFQRQDDVRQQELKHLNERLQNFVGDLSSKDKEFEELSRRLEESRKALEEMEKAKTAVAAELMTKEDILEETRDKLSKQQIDFNSQLDAIKSDFADLEFRLREENHELQGQIDEALKQLNEARAAAKDGAATKRKLDEMQTALISAESSLQDEKVRHEDEEGELRMELAKVEGRLRASESSIDAKKARIQELEKQVDASNASSSIVAEKQAEIESLRQEVQAVREARLQKEVELSEVQAEISALQGKLDGMSRIDNALIEQRRKSAEVEYALSQKDAELSEVTKAYDETRTKLLDAEQRYSTAKTDFALQLSTKEKLIERYERSFKDLEIKLQKEHDTNIDLEMSTAELRRNVEALERQKVRKDTELTNLRKDYEDLSGLLEENLHSSAKKGDLDTQLKRREREMREKVDMYNHNVNDLEEKLKQSELSKNQLEGQVKKLKNSLDDLNDEKLKLRADLSSLRKKYEEVSFKLETARDQAESKGGVEAEHGRKDRLTRDAIQRYTSNIADLESKLEEEVQAKVELEDRLSSVRSELEDKQQHTEELVQRHHKATREMESDLAAAIAEKEELKAKLEQTKKDLDQKRKELMQTVSKFSNGNQDLHSVKQGHDEFRQLSDPIREELDRKTKQVDELKRKIPELLSELQTRNRECDEAKSSAKRLETELIKRKEQFNEVVKRYSDQIAVLESELDSRSSTEDKVQNVRAEAMSKDSKIRELQDAIQELEVKLDIAQKNRESAKVNADSLARELDNKESDARRFEMEKIELETKLQTHVRSKEELRSKVSELSSKLERKEREIREVTDRYKVYVMELESKLDKDTDAKHQLKLDIDRLKNELNSAAEVREKLYSSETEVEMYRVKALEAEFKSKEYVRSLEAQLNDALKAHHDLEVLHKKNKTEKVEVIAALEGVIDEVRDREVEIESLSNLLHEKDEELEHAKIIAAKAVQSAEDMQKRFKNRDRTQQSELMQRMDELSDNVDTLSRKNETLQRKIGMLERDLREKNLECRRLMDQLRHTDGNHSFRDAPGPAIDDAHSAFETSGVRIQTGAPMDPEGYGLGLEPFSPMESMSPSADFGGENMFSKEVEFPDFEQKLSEDISTDAASRWSHDFESDNRSAGIDSVGSEPIGRSRKSIERDALRKYVKQRYMSKR